MKHVVSASFLCVCTCFAAAADESQPDALIATAVRELVAMQEDDGAWPYEGVYRVASEIPVGYRAGGTAIVCITLLQAAPDDAAAATAIERGIELILQTLDDPLLAPSTEDAYDVRVWAHGYVLECFCRLRAANRGGRHAAQIATWIPRLVAILRIEQLTDGGWNYAGRRRHASFVTAPVVQALLLARAQGEDVPDELLTRAATALRDSRYAFGAFAYSGFSGTNASNPTLNRPSSEPDGRATTSRPASAAPSSTTPTATTLTASAPTSQRWTRDERILIGSIARSPICETTLLLLGDGSPDAVRAALHDFHRHWEHLETRRRQTGTHVAPFGIAPYYFYYGHRYAAQAIEFLPPAERAAARARLLETILRTRDTDGTWNDRVFPRSRNFGTAMIILALLGERQPAPLPWHK